MRLYRRVCRDLVVHRLESTSEVLNIRSSWPVLRYEEQSLFCLRHFDVCCYFLSDHRFR
jgi:hypothetical protein